MLGIEKGDTYDKKTLHKRLGIQRETDIEDMSQISSLYQNNGYLMSMIEPSEIVVGNDSISKSKYSKVVRSPSTTWTSAVTCAWTTK